MDNEERIIKTLAPLAAVFPNWKPTKPTIAVYAATLAGLDPELLEAAVLSLLVDPLEFMPTPGSIRAKANKLVAVQAGDPHTYAAWGQLVTVWNGGGKEDLHPLVLEAANRIGGLHSIGQSKNLTAERSRFIAAYEEVIEEHDFWEIQLPEVQNFLLGKGLGDQPRLTSTTQPPRIPTDD